jgi:photosystem II stability/assembly factor-like uncharacterized protein
MKKIWMNLRRASLISLILTLTAGLSFADMWRRVNNGLSSMPVGAIALTIDPVNPSVIYAVAGAGIFKTSNGAADWHPLSSIANVNAVAVDPNGVLYASTNNGVSKSTDGGENWISTASGLSGLPSKVVIDPLTPYTLYVALLPNGGVYKSTDAGATWTILNGAPRNTLSLTIDPATPSTLYANTISGNVLSKTLDGGETWTTLDIGIPSSNSFGPFALAPSDPSTIYLTYRNAATRSPAIARSTDGGMSWTTYDAPTLAGAATFGITIDPSDPSTAYLFYSLPQNGRIARTSDGGATWTEIVDALPGGSVFRALVIDPSDPAVVYGAFLNEPLGIGGMLKSSNRGTNWDRADSGLSVMDIRALTVDPVNRATVYTGGRDGLFKSIDRGENWTKLADFQLPAPSFSPPIPPPPFGAGPALLRSLLVDFSNPNVLYAGTVRYNACAAVDKLLFKSVDGGVTWTDTFSPPNSGCRFANLLVMDPSNPNTLYSLDSDDGDWLLKSNDGGAHWTTVADFTSGLEAGLFSLAIDPQRPTTIFAGVGDISDFKPGTTATGLLKSTDGGRTLINSGLRGNAVTVLAIHPSDSSIMYAATEGVLTTPRGFRGLYKTSDGGSTWDAINDGLGTLVETPTRITALVINSVNPNVIYAASSGRGVLKSSNGGMSWSPFSDGLSNLDVRLLAFAPDDSHTLYAGTSSGVFKIADVLPAANQSAHR